MRLYFDTAYMAKCYLNETDAARVRALARKATSRYSSSLCIAELASVLYRHVRERSLTPTAAHAKLDTFLEDVQQGVWTLLPVSDRLLFRVEKQIRRLPAAIFLRAADAVHLVAAEDAGFTEIWTNDRHMLAAAPAFGLIGCSV